MLEENWQELAEVLRDAYEDAVLMGVDPHEMKRLLAEQHENIMRAPLAPTEAARIYQELKAVYQEEARANIAAHQFGAAAQPGLPTVGTPSCRRSTR